MYQALKLLFTGWLVVLLCSCAGPDPLEPQSAACPPAQCPACPACAPCPKCPEPAAAAPPSAAPDAPATLRPAAWSDLPGLSEDALLPALPALRNSCEKLADQARWRSFCAALGQLPATPARAQLAALLRAQLAPWQVVNLLVDGPVLSKQAALVEHDTLPADPRPRPIESGPIESGPIGSGPIESGGGR